MSGLVYVVQYGYDGTTHAFTTEGLAKEHVAELERAGEDASYRSYLLDPPRRQRYSAFCIELTPGGEVVYEEWVSYCTPDQAWEGNQVVGAHFWRTKDEITLSANGSVLRAHGVNRDEALSRAHRLLAFLPTDSAVEADGGKA